MPKSKWLTIRVTPEEYEQIRQDAESAGLVDNISAFVLMLYRKWRVKK